MNDPGQPQDNRREALCRLGRYGALTALGAISARVLFRPRAEADTDCRRPIACADCPALARCGLPRAVQIKRAAAR